MAGEFDLLSTTDRPALLGLNSTDRLAACRKTLEGLGYKVHSAISHADFLFRCAQAQYQNEILEELFDASSRAENQSLTSLQGMPMAQRRHAVSFLFGPSYQTLHPMQAFQESVHAEVNAGDVYKLHQIVQKVMADNDLFYNAYRDTLLRMAQGK